MLQRIPSSFSSLRSLAGPLLALTFLATSTPAQGTATVRNGSGVNPTVLSATGPIPGTNWALRVADVPPQVQVLYEARLGASQGTFTTAGEVLIDRSTPLLFRGTATSVQGEAILDQRIPADPRLTGLDFSVQAIVGASEGRLTNAVDARIGAVESPNAEFVPSSALGTLPHTVTFRDLSAGTVGTWLWDFGNGATSTDPTPVYTYTQPGTYTVTLTVDGPAGQSVRTRTDQVYVFSPVTSIQPGSHLEVSDLETLNPITNPRADVLDLTGTQLHTFTDPMAEWGFAELSKPLSNGHLLAMIYNRNTAGPNVQKMLVETDWAGNIVWSFDPRPARVHHDFERMANGNTLVVYQAAESWPSINPNTIWNDYIVEVDPTGSVVWTWSMAANWALLPFSTAERNYLFSFPGVAPKAVFHLNSVATLPANKWEATDTRFTQGNIIVSLRETNKVFIIDPVANAVVWSYDDVIGQHHARMIPQGTPGAGNILIFDNGGASGAPPVFRSYSRIVEIDPITLEEVWSFEDPNRFFTDTMGGVQRLANGNTLITESLSALIFEIDPAGRTLWQRLRPSGKPVYRAYRVDSTWQNGSVYFPW